MSEKDVFASNLRRLIDRSPLSKRQVADRAGVSYATLRRWLDSGVRIAERRHQAPLQRICRMLRVELDDLWRVPAPPGALVYPEKVRQLYEHWEELGSEGSDLSRLLDRWIAAVRVAERFLEEEADLAAVVVKVKNLRDQRDVQLYLEGLLREWDVSEEDAYRRLIETTQRFLAAALPKDAEQLGLWFIQVHANRWNYLIKTRKLDNEPELFAYIRHLMAEGLSALEAYESVLRMSTEPPAVLRKRRASK